MIKKILRSGDPVLRKLSEPVVKIDNKVLSIIGDLKDTLQIQKDPEGVGLAAPQIGKNIRVFVTSFRGVKRVVINPEILQISEKTKKPNLGKPLKKPNKKGGGNLLEGCLSLPNYFGSIKRVSNLKLKYLNEKGEEVIEEFKDFYAQIVMHEIDHLNGILFLDRLLEQKSSLYKVDGKNWEEIELV